MLHDTTAAPLGTIGIITADRPAALARALGSFADHCLVHDRWPRVLVVDGSQRAANRTATRAAVTAIARTTRRDLRYVGPEEAAAWRALSQGRRRVPTLAPGSAGANRNLLLLMTAGERVLFVDDDMVCDTWMSPARRDGLVVMGHEEIRQMEFHPDRAAARAAVQRTPADLLHAHEALLARPLSDLVERSPTPPDLGHACEHIRARLQAGQTQVVRVTFSGLAGDSGTYCPGRLLFSSGSCRERLWSDPAQFAIAMTRREMSRIAATNVVTHVCHCSAGCMGLSNLTVAPPFPPVGRNEDGVFGVLLAATDPAALFAHVPVGIVHDSDRPPGYSGGPLGSAEESRLAELLIALLLRPPPLAAASPGDRMREVGERLTAVDRLGAAACAALVVEVTRETRAREIEFADAGAGAVECPAYWRSALSGYRARLRQAMRQPEFFLPIEFRDAPSLETGYRSLGAVLRRFGRLVESWPERWEAARERISVRRD